jgi:hypothetical protein
LGFLDMFGGAATPEKAQKLKAKVTQKYGDPASRQKAIAQLGDMKIPEAVTALMARFTIVVDPQTTDVDEKDHVFDLIRGFGQDAVAPVTEFLRKSEHATSWALKLLMALLPEQEVVKIATDLLVKLSSEYSRDPEKKVVLIHFLEGKDDPRIAPALVPFLSDAADDVKIATLKMLGPLKFEPAREAMLNVLTADDTARRVQTAAISALHQSEFGVQGFREKVERLATDPYFVDKSGVVKRRG